MKTESMATTKNKKKVDIITEPQRNEGIPFDLDFINDLRINKSAVERRAASLGKRRSVKKEWQAAWFLRAITCIDLTTLAGDDTPSNVIRLCAKAKQPVRQDILDALGMGKEGITTGAVCVYHNLIDTAKEALKGSNIPIAAVSTGFPAGQIPLEEKIKQIKLSVAAGAKEIDIVVSRAQVLTGDCCRSYVCDVCFPSGQRFVGVRIIGF